MAWYQRLGAVGFAVQGATVLQSGERGGVVMQLDSMRERLTSRIVEVLPGTIGGMAAALLTGEQTAMDKNTMQAMRDSGLAHLLSISGLHIAFVSAIVMGLVRYGLALVKQGQVAEGLAQFHASMEALQGMQSGDAQALRLTQLAELYRNSGQSEAGLHALAAAMAADTEERFDVAGRYRSQGELLLLLPDPDLRQAETCFQQALAVARCQQAKSLELRAAISLSRLWHQHGETARAHDLLTARYAGFSEGHQTVDLQEAQCLIELLVKAG